MLPLMTCEALTQAYRAMLPDEYRSPLHPKELQSRLLRGGGAPQNPLHSNRQMMTLVVGALLLVAFGVYTGTAIPRAAGGWGPSEPAAFRKICIGID